MAFSFIHIYESLFAITSARKLEKRVIDKINFFHSFLMQTCLLKDFEIVEYILYLFMCSVTSRNVKKTENDQLS